MKTRILVYGGLLAIAAMTLLLVREAEQRPGDAGAVTLSLTHFSAGQLHGKIHNASPGEVSVETDGASWMVLTDGVWLPPPKEAFGPPICGFREGPLPAVRLRAGKTVDYRVAVPSGLPASGITVRVMMVAESTFRRTTIKSNPFDFRPVP